MLYSFERFSLDTERRELCFSGAVRALEPQVFDLLELLIRNRDRVVGRDEIFNAIWRGRFVSEAVLTTRINAARTAIDDTGVRQRLIRTLRTKGFRFVGVVGESSKAPIRIAERSTGESQISIPLYYPSIAVVPFDGEAAHAGEQSVADGLTEGLIATLSNSAWLIVRSRNTSFALRRKKIPTQQLAMRLGVRYLLAGSVRNFAGRTRIAAQLIDGLIDRQLWAGHYDLDGPDILAAQDDIVEKLAAAIEPAVYRAEELRARRATPEQLNAWECMLRALSLMNSREKSNVVAAQNYLQRAITLNPNSARAHSLLSMAITMTVHMGWARRQTTVPLSLAAAQAALAEYPDEPWGHAALGYAMIWQQPEAALPSLQHAISLNPKFSVGHYMLALASTFAGQRGEVSKHADLSEQFARGDLMARGYRGAHYHVRSTAAFADGEFHRGIEFASKAVVECPQSPSAYRALVINLALGDRVDESRQALCILKRCSPEVSQQWIADQAVWVRAAELKRYGEAFRIAGLR